MKRFCFSKEEHLLKTFQFKSVYQQGRLLKSKYAWIYSMANGLDHNRIGLSVSNKSCSNIVLRNKVKRILREVFRLNKEMFGQGSDIVIVLKQCPEVVCFESIREIISTCLCSKSQTNEPKQDKAKTA